MSGWSAESIAAFAAVAGEDVPPPPTPCSLSEPGGWRRCAECPIPDAAGAGEPCSVGDLIHALFTPPHTNVGSWASGAGVPHREGWAR